MFLFFFYFWKLKFRVNIHEILDVLKAKFWQATTHDESMKSLKAEKL